MLKKVISYILVFVLIIVLTVDIAVTILSQTILKEEFMTKAFAQNDYYIRIYNNIIEKFKDNTVQTGLTEDVLDGIITEERVAKDVNAFLSYIYNDKKELNVEVATIEQKLRENIDKQLSENARSLSKEQQKSIDTYVNVITEIYRKSIIFTNSIMPTIQQSIIKIKSILKIAMPVLYIVAIAIIVILAIMNKKKSIKYISISTLGSGLLLIIAKILEVSSIKIQNVLILNKAFSDTIIYAVQNIMTGILISGIVLVVIGISINFFNKDAEEESKVLTKIKQKIVLGTKREKKH